jgi:hydroxyacylglutathione hydrolase
MQTMPSIPLISGIPAFRDNYIWLIQHESRAWVVDPGDAEPVLHVLSLQNLQLDGILLTHHHADHIGGVEQLQQHYQNRLTVYGPAVEEIPGCTVGLVGGENLNLLGVPVQVLSVPAHTRGHLAYYAEPLRALFCGDALFGAGCGRLFEGSPSDLLHAMTLIRVLPSDTQIYCAHEYTMMNLGFAQAVEPDNSEITQRVSDTQRLRDSGLPSVPSTLALECATNPFLRWDQSVVMASAKTQESDVASDVDVIRVLREWRNRF